MNPDDLKQPNNINESVRENVDPAALINETVLSKVLEFSKTPLENSTMKELQELRGEIIVLMLEMSMDPAAPALDPKITTLLSRQLDSVNGVSKWGQFSRIHKMLACSEEARQV